MEYLMLPEPAVSRVLQLRGGGKPVRQETSQGCGRRVAGTRLGSLGTVGDGWEPSRAGEEVVESGSSTP